MVDWTIADILGRILEVGIIYLFIHGAYKLYKKRRDKE